MTAGSADAGSDCSERPQKGDSQDSCQAGKENVTTHRGSPFCDHKAEVAESKVGMFFVSGRGFIHGPRGQAGQLRVRLASKTQGSCLVALSNGWTFAPTFVEDTLDPFARSRSGLRRRVLRETVIP